MLQVMGTENYFLKNTPTAQEITAKTDTWDCTNLKSFGTEEKKIYLSEKMATEWEIDEKHEKNARLISRVYQELKNS